MCGSNSGIPGGQPDGFDVSAGLNNFHRMTIDSVMGHVRDRFFNPEVGGLIFNSVHDNPVFRIDVTCREVKESS